MSSSTQASPISADNFSAIFEATLTEYKNRTGQDLQSHPFAISLDDNNTPDAILEVFRREAQAFENFRRNDKLMEYLTPIVSILFTLSATLRERIGLVFSPAKPIFAAIGFSLGIVKDMKASYEKLVDLFERMHFFLQRLERYTGIPLPPDMIDLLGKIMAQVLSVLAYSTYAINQCRAREFFRRLVGRTDVENALLRLNMLTKEENLLTTARNLEITHRVDVNVQENMKINQRVVHEVTALEGVVHDVLANENMIREGVRNVNDNVTSMKHAMDGAQRNQLREKLMAWLAPPDPSINHNTACGTQHEGTASWFLESDTFDEWKQNGSVLWIRGNPGSGKTVICSAIIEDIKRMPKGSCLIAYHYFDFKDAAKRDVRGLLASLLKQLVRFSDPCWDVLHQLFETCDNGSEQPSERALANCLQSMIELSEELPIFIILDALDECPNPGDSSPREKVLNFLEYLLLSNRSNLHVCITSRPEQDILSTLNPLTPVSRRVSLHEEGGQKEDINSYIRSFVHTNKTMRRWKAGDKEMVITTLTNRAGGMFRWVYCQLDSLSQCFPSSIRNALIELPTTLDDTYERILQGIPKQKRDHALRLFQCMITAFRPLRVEELAEILAINFDLNAATRLVEGWRPENPEEDVLSACSTLIAIIDDNGAKIVQFSHFSVKEFLTSDRLRMSSKDGDICEYYIPLEPAHTILVRACLAVLLQLDGKVDKKQLAAFPLASYAAHRWVDHAKFRNVTAEIQDVIEYFFNPNKPHLRVWTWIFDVQYEDDPSRNFSDKHPPPLTATPLYYAAACGFSGLAEHLIVVHEGDVNAAGRLRETPLHAASRRGHIDAARVLISHGADTNAQDEWDWAPLHRASHKGHLKVAQLLLEHEADLTALTKANDTPLLLSSREGYVQVTRLLLDRGADVNARGEWNWTPLHWASHRGHLKIAHLLLEHQANLAAQTKSLQTPLILASREGHFEIAQLLLDRGADVNAWGQLNWTPLHWAASKGHLNVAQLLLDRKADVNSQSNAHDAPITLASQEGHIEVVRLLLDYGADATISGFDGLTPLQNATEKGHHNVSQLLLEHTTGSQ